MIFFHIKAEKDPFSEAAEKGLLAEIIILDFINLKIKS